MLEDKILPLKNGSAIFLTLRNNIICPNAGSEDYMIVLNVELIQTVMTVIEHMSKMNYIEELTQVTLFLKSLSGRVQITWLEK